MTIVNQLVAQMLWFPLLHDFLETLLAMPQFHQNMQWCRLNYWPFVEEARNERDPMLRANRQYKLMVQFTQSVRPLESLLLSRNIQFLESKENKWVNFACLPDVWRSPSCTTEVRSYIWDKLLALELVAAFQWRLRFNETLDECFLLTQSLGGQSTQFVPLLFKKMGTLMKEQKLTIQEAKETFTYLKELFHGERTPGEKSPLDDLLNMCATDPEQQLFAQVLQALKKASHIGLEDLLPVMEMVGDKLGVDTAALKKMDFEQLQNNEEKQAELEVHLTNPKLIGAISKFQENFLSSGNLSSAVAVVLGEETKKQCQGELSKIEEKKNRKPSQEQDMLDLICSGPPSSSVHPSPAGPPLSAPILAQQARHPQ